MHIAQKKFWTVLKTPAFLILLVSLGILAVNIAYVGKYRPFNSDDIYWQRALQSWRPFNGQTIYLGTKDIFVEQVPYFAILGHFFNPSRKLLIFESISLTLTAFTLVYCSTLYFLRKLRIKPSYTNLLPFVWLASFGYAMLQNYLNTDWRTFEIGLSFATFAFIAAITNEDFRPLKSIKNLVLTVLACFGIGIVIYSDPYFIFFTVFPLALFGSLLYLRNKISAYLLSTMLVILAFSFAFAKLIQIVSSKAGLFFVADTPSVFTGFDNIVTNVVASVHGLLIIFGADFFGRPAVKLSTFLIMINAVLLGYIIYKVWAFRAAFSRDAVKGTNLPQLWIAFFPLVMAITFVVYSSSTLAASSNFRFYFIFVFTSIAFLSIVMGLTKKRSNTLIVSSLLVGATIVNLGNTLVTSHFKLLPEVKNNVGNSINFEIINTVRKEGLTKGYAGYWQANIDTYFSDNTVDFLPSWCLDNGKSRDFQWLIESGQYRKAATRTFFVYDPSPSFTFPPNCTEEQLFSQFGGPKKVINVGDKKIFVYDYDIASRISAP